MPIKKVVPVKNQNANPSIKKYATDNAGKIVRQGNVVLGKIVGYGKRYIYISPMPKATKFFAAAKYGFISVVKNIDKTKPTIRLSELSGLVVFDSKPKEEKVPSRWSLLEID